jgi:hypothetical protein
VTECHVHPLELQFRSQVTQHRVLRDVELIGNSKLKKTAHEGNNWNRQSERL